MMFLKIEDNIGKLEVGLSPLHFKGHTHITADWAGCLTVKSGVWKKPWRKVISGDVEEDEGTTATVMHLHGDFMSCDLH